jgi:hypothetical protein
MSKDIKGTKKYIGDIASTKVKNIFYFLFFKTRVVGKHGRENIGGYWKGPKCFSKQQKAQQEDIMGAIKVNAQVREN